MKKQIAKKMLNLSVVFAVVLVCWSAAVFACDPECPDCWSGDDCDVWEGCDPACTGCETCNESCECEDDDDNCTECEECVDADCILDGTCKECSGYSHWSGAAPDAGQPPNCSQRETSRTLGSCVSSSTPGSCSEGTHTTTHITTYYLEGPTLYEKVICSNQLGICLDAGWKTEEECMQEHQDCLNAYSDCIVVSNYYGGDQTGCV